MARGVAAGVLERGRGAVVARAPGRLDVMGGIADYSGSLVLQMPIAEATYAAVQAVDEPWVSIASGDRRVRTDVELYSRSNATYEGAREFWGAMKDSHWAAYVAGVLTALRVEKGVGLSTGLRIYIESRVPEGKGVSSSAALEVATMQAVAALLNVELDGVELATYCQRVENLVVGAPCGIMDQTASACGRAGKLLALRCQPAEILGHVDLPRELSVWGIDSGIRHAVTGADYGTVRAAAFMGYRVLRELAGGSGAGGDRWNGYLANTAPSEFEAFASALPEAMRGAEFLERYRAHDDAVTRVEPEKTYPVRAATRHPIGEHHRIRVFAKLLSGTLDDEALALLGESMYQSHASYSACGLGSDGTDRLVAMVREAGPEQGLYGGKITGGGSGGTVAVLGRADAGGAVRALAERYAAETGREAYVFEGSGPGAVEWGVQRVAV